MTLKQIIKILLPPPKGSAPIPDDLQGAGPVFDRKENWHGDNWWDWLIIRLVNFFS